ncbi:FeoB-associated Cys-rich membrane protein [Dissulfurimicrobium hydrothermale]|nr:FeoB-associated Cys-rich membrane protein [Dissulfurimicrobium hydrothermale]
MIVLFGALFFIGRTIFRQIKGKSSSCHICSCGCEGCGDQPSDEKRI